MKLKIQKKNLVNEASKAKCFIQVSNVYGQEEQEFNQGCDRTVEFLTLDMKRHR